MNSVNGLLLVDKPSGWTSFDAVNYVRRIVANAEGKKPKHVKVGHTGTLDPLATGLLVLLIGSYTKRAPELSKLDKTYDVTMTLGATSTTGDREGEITQTSDREPSKKEITEALQNFSGELSQIPPAYSAIKINGQRAYKLARQGKTVEIEPRKVTVHDIRLHIYKYPEAQFTARVSSGTYIRSLVEDIGKELKTGAYMSGLRRTHVGGFNLRDAAPVDKMDADIIAGRLLTLP
jgi:tRNA pseudouridine55 synthase